MTPSDWLFNDMTDWHGYKGFNYIFLPQKKAIFTGILSFL